MKKNYSSIFYSIRIVLFILFPSFLIAQQHTLWQGKEAYNWCFGEQKGLNFNTTPPTELSNIQLNALEGSISMSNSDGQLLFYGAQGKIWNRNHEVMPNGTGMFFDESSTQYGVAVPKPGNADIYYVFTIGSINHGLAYSEVDMSLEEGYGAVTSKNVPLNDDAKTEKITAAYHANGKDIWVVTHLLGSNNFVAYLVTENGVAATPVTSAGGIEYPAYDPEAGNIYQIFDYTVGQMKISPDGTKLASAISGAFFGESKGLEVFDFNTTTGEVSNPIFIDGFTGFLYGVEFSPNSRYLYTGDPVNAIFYVLYGKVQQYDLQAGDEQAIKDSKTVIADFTGSISSVGGIQLTPEGKIYIYNLSKGGYHTINYPNNPGLSCGFVASDAVIASGSIAFPTFIQTYFESGILHEGECTNQEVTFSTLRIPGITSISWNFGDPDSGASNISNQPVHIFSAPGTYTVTAQITSNDAVQTATTKVVIIAGANAALPNAQDLALCDDGTGKAIFNLSQFNAAILAGQNPDTFSVSYFTNEDDAKANENSITTSSEFSTTGQTIYAVVTSSASGCRAIIHFNLVVNPLPLVTAPQNLEQCSTVFNLRIQDAVILNGQNLDTFKVTYYTDANGTTVITQPESFLSTGQTVFASVLNTTTNCSVMTSFDLAITPATILPGNLIIEGCSPFDLTLVAGQLEPGLTLSFYKTEQDATNETNAIEDPKKYAISDINAIVYVVAKTAEGCISLGELKLQSVGCVIPKGISPNGDGMNDTFNLSAFDVKYLGIFNRYGQEVFSHENYTDQWYGQGNNGDELPTGTYYYVIERTTGERTTGWVYINRNAN
ncbi:PKD domain protein [compost metagenome]